MNELSSHLVQIRSAFEGPAWHGPALLEALDGVTPHVAKRRWVDGAHTIWEIALHTVAWKRTVVKFLDGAEKIVVEEDENFPRPEAGDEAEWGHVLNELKIAQAEFLATVSRFGNARLYETPKGREWTYNTWIFGVVHHDLYHAGQIMLLRKAAEAEIQGSRVK
ncbi:MAG: DinB family protein [bacterium]|nr:DinB family protein [bacterium]